MRHGEQDTRYEIFIWSSRNADGEAPARQELRRRSGEMFRLGQDPFEGGEVVEGQIEGHFLNSSRAAAEEIKHRGVEPFVLGRKQREHLIA